MGNVIQLRPNLSAAESLRNIADMMDSGEIANDECTLIAGTEVFHCGQVHDDQAAANAVFNMTYGISKLMQTVHLNEE